MEVPPPRLTLLAARDAPVAVVLRRGPTEWVRLYLWRTDTDEVEPGQWLHARVYERRCDLSPDGRLFAAFVFDASPAPGRGADSWLAISRPPWFRALALWWVGSTWSSGAVFTAADRIWTGLADGPDEGRLPGWLRVDPDLPVAEPGRDFTDRLTPLNRWHRDGWERVARAPERWRRPLADGRYLHRVEHGPDPTAPPGHWWPVEHEVEDRGERTGLQADAAEVDHHGGLLIARDGRLEREGPTGRRVVADLTTDVPDPRPAPGQAARWPSDR